MHKAGGMYFENEMYEIFFLNVKYNKLNAFWKALISLEGIVNVPEELINFFVQYLIM